MCSKIKGATPKNVVHVNIQFLGPISKMNELCSFPRQIIQYHANPSLCFTSKAEEAEVEQFYEDLRDLLELTLKKKKREREMSFSL